MDIVQSSLISDSFGHCFGLSGNQIKEIPACETNRKQVSLWLSNFLTKTKKKNLVEVPTLDLLRDDYITDFYSNFPLVRELPYILLSSILF